MRKPSARRRLFSNPEVLVLLLGYACLMGPALYGAFLHNLGLPTLAAAVFVAASILAGIAWGIYNMRPR